MKNISLILAMMFLGAVCLPSSQHPQAQTPPKRSSSLPRQIASPEDAKAQDIRHLLELMGAGKVGAQMMDQMFTTIRASAKQVPESVWRELIDEVKAEFSPETLIELNVPIYAKHYTHDEIKQLIAFYDSPIGKKVTEVMPLIVKEAYDAGIEHGREVLRRIQERLRRKGYTPQVG